MDEKLIAFLSQRIIEDQQQNTWRWTGTSVVGDIRHGLLSIAERLSRRDDAELNALADQMSRLLAYAYFDHPEYQTEWTPDWD